MNTGMTFKEIKTGSTVYILDKKSFSVSECKVTGTAPHVGAVGTLAQGQIMVDVTIDEGGKQREYAIPEHLSVTYAGDKVLSLSKQALAPEVERTTAEAERELALTDWRKEWVSHAPELLAMLNPQYRERQETEKRFQGIEKSVNDVRELVQKLCDKLS